MGLFDGLTGLGMAAGAAAGGAVRGELAGQQAQIRLQQMQQQMAWRNAMLQSQIDYRTGRLRQGDTRIDDMEDTTARHSAAQYLQGIQGFMNRQDPSYLQKTGMWQPMQDELQRGWAAVNDHSQPFKESGFTPRFPMAGAPNPDYNPVAPPGGLVGAPPPTGSLVGAPPPAAAPAGPTAPGAANGLGSLPPDTGAGPSPDQTPTPAPAPTSTPQPKTIPYGPFPENPRIEIARQNANAHTQSVAQQGTAITSENDYRGFLTGLAQRKFNMDDAAKMFDERLQLADRQFAEAKGNAQYQEQIWSKLLTDAAEYAKLGGQPNNALKPFLISHGMGGMTSVNEPATRAFLKGQGYDDGTINSVIGGYGGGGGAANPFANPGAAPAVGTQQPGGPPVLPPVGAGTAPQIPGIEKLQGMQPGAMQAAIAGISAAGMPVTINSGYRDESKQASLYANRANNPNPVAPPGHSDHERGIAMDLSAGNGDQAGLAQKLAPYGWTWAGASDPVHFVYKGAPGGAATPGGAQPAAGGGGGGGVPMGAGPAAGAASVGVNLPTTAPPTKNPYAPKSLEGQIFDLYTQGAAGPNGKRGQPKTEAEIMQSFAGRPDLQQIVGQVIRDANQTQNAGLMHGIPAMDTGGAQLPVPQDLSGLEYNISGAPGGGIINGTQTTPVVLQGGFSGPGTPATPPGGGGGVTITERPPRLIGPPVPGNLTKPITPGIKSFQGGGGGGSIVHDQPGPWAPPPEPVPPARGGGGASVSQTIKGQLGAPGELGTKAMHRIQGGIADTFQDFGKRPIINPTSVLGRAIAAATNIDPNSGLGRVLGLDQNGPQDTNPATIAPHPPSGAAPGGPAMGKVLDDLKRYKSGPYAPGIEKWLAVNKVTDPEEQQAIYQIAYQHIIPQLIQSGVPVPRIREQIGALLTKNGR